ncbi:MAG TPA: type II toxin-antitoxin system Phd/YefM family antitoxin, partial [Acetobacteraceae bacterium]|nr:type II toxin-antitoxin system Phd/YefM family antitoxin [Acetobacteraceae bacterium]
KGNVVMISEAEFDGWQETVHLLRSPANARHLLRSVRSAEVGETSVPRTAGGTTGTGSSKTRARWGASTH